MISLFTQFFFVGDRALEGLVACVIGELHGVQWIHIEPKQLVVGIDNTVNGIFRDLNLKGG